MITSLQCHSPKPETNSILQTDFVNAYQRLNQGLIIIHVKMITASNLFTKVIELNLETALIFHIKIQFS